MRTNRLPDWLFPVLLLAGAALFAVGIIGFLATPASSSALGKQYVQATTPTDTSTTTDCEPTGFDGTIAYRHLLAQTEIGPKPTGSDAGWATGDFIIKKLESAGWSAESQAFIYKGIKGRNIIGRHGSGSKIRSSTGVIILAAHYDTRPAADRDPNPAHRAEWIQGANDGASGVDVLLELARVLKNDGGGDEIWLVFFDAEDRGQLAGWPFSVGARYLAEHLTVNPKSVIIIDMVGDANQNIYFERYSTALLGEEIWAVAAKLGYESYFIPEVRHFVIDDHIPFLERGIPAVDIIDFDYPFWHTVEDTVDKVAPESLERVGRTLELYLEDKIAGCR